ncbi:MAG: phosphoglucosamine mutase [Opitutus sp.]
MKRQYFGTDGVRGPYGGPVINENFAARLGVAVARWLNGRGRILIGRDTRASGVSLEAAIARGLRLGGVEPVSLGVVPTPAVARAVVQEKAALGVVITASHNPAVDNGIKFFGPRGVKLTDEQELEIERQLESVAGATADSSGVEALEGASQSYIAASKALLPSDSLRGWTIVLDTANGATCATSPSVLRGLGARVVGIGDAPDGHNINEGVGSEHPEQLAKRVRETNAHLGVAHDGDGDRCILCDELGEVLDGDEILTILATDALKHATLVRSTLVVTMQSNLGVDAAIVAAGGRVCRTSVGDRYVIERMLEEGATLGGESSGHIICSEISPTGDGLVAAIRVISVMLSTGLPLSQLRKSLRKFPQLSRALRVQEKQSLETLPTIRSTIATLESELGSSGRVLVRYSGTEAKIRLLVEGPTNAAVEDGIARLESSVRADLRVV